MFHQSFFRSFAFRDVKLPVPPWVGRDTLRSRVMLIIFSILPVSVPLQGFSIPVKTFQRMIPMTLELEGLIQAL